MLPAPGVFIAGMVIFLVVAWDAFEVIILPRRVTRKFRLTRFYYRSTWGVWKAVARSFSSGKRRESFLGFFGPISLLFIGVWAIGLILSFGMMQYGAGSALSHRPDPQPVHGYLSQRDRVSSHLDSATWFRVPAHRSFSGRRGSWFWFRLSRLGRWLSPIILRVRRARGRYLLLDSPRRHASHCR